MLTAAAEKSSAPLTPLSSTSACCDTLYIVPTVCPNNNKKNRRPTLLLITLTLLYSYVFYGYYGRGTRTKKRHFFLAHPVVVAHVYYNTARFQEKEVEYRN